MKFLVANIQKTMSDTTVVSFFFNARGEDLEKSTLGMYRSLIYQILKEFDLTQTCLDQARSAAKLGFNQNWDENELQDIFESLIRDLGPKHLICFIDALDECNDDQVRDMVAFLERLGQASVLSNTHFQICLSSRHYPHISIKKSIQIVLEDEEDHNHDITKYLNAKLMAGRSKKMDNTRDSVERKSCGIFLWVVLVVPILNKAYDQGKIHALEKRLDEVPKGLDALFEDILIRDQVDIAEFVLCLQWVLYANRPLRREELYYAMVAGNDADTLHGFSPEDVTVQEMNQYILHCSKGFAEVTKTKASTVQFIHESVREFFLKNVKPEQLQSKLIPGASHDSLKKCCQTYMALNTISHGLRECCRTVIEDMDVFSSRSRLPKASTQEARLVRDAVQVRFPFLDYAVRNVLLHADTAGRFGVSQTKFLRDFELGHWVLIDNILERYEIRRHSKNVSMLYVLAEKNLSTLVRVQRQLDPSPTAAVHEYEDERYGSPVQAAIANRVHSEDVIDALMGPPTSYDYGK